MSMRISSCLLKPLMLDSVTSTKMSCVDGLITSSFRLPSSSCVLATATTLAQHSTSFKAIPLPIPLNKMYGHVTLKLFARFIHVINSKGASIYLSNKYKME